MGRSIFLNACTLTKKGAQLLRSINHLLGCDPQANFIMLYRSRKSPGTSSQCSASEGRSSRFGDWLIAPLVAAQETRRASTRIKSFPHLQTITRRQVTEQRAPIGPLAGLRMRKGGRPCQD